MKYLVLFWFVCYSVVANGQNIPRIPQTGLQLALEDYKQINDSLKPFIRYIWIPDGSQDSYAALTLVINSVISQSSLEICPEIAANGALIRLNFLNLVDDSKDTTKLMNLWDSLAFSDPYFSIPQIQTSKDKKTTTKVTLAAPYLKSVFTPGFIYRSDWLLSSISRANDGGFYYKFIGIEPNKTKLEDYLKVSGASFDEALKHNAVEAAGISVSRVTGKPRKIKYWYGQGVRPTTGRPLAIITEDIFDDNIDPSSNPFSSLLNNKPDGKELFKKRNNGYWEFSLWNQNDIAVVEAPPNLVRDNTVPVPFTNRLTPGKSCISCHANESIIQTFHNDVFSILNGPGVILTDNSQFNKRTPAEEADFKAKKQILFEFGAPEIDVSNLIKDERQAIDTRIFNATKLLNNRYNIKQAANAFAAIYNNYEYEYITPRSALEELGINVPKDDETGIKTFKAVLPVNNLAPESVFLIRLQTSWIDPETKVVHTGQLTRREWEQVFQLAIVKAEPQINELLKKEENK